MRDNPNTGMAQIRFLLESTILVFLYLGGLFAITEDISYIITILGASIAGSIIMVYFRRDLTRKETFFRAICSSICGLVVGSVVATYEAVEREPYIIAIYFFASLISLFFIRAVLNLSERNAEGITSNILNNVFSKRLNSDSSVTTKAALIIEENIKPVLPEKQPEESS